jgi:2-succinyl-5-enolpyruvyl-6-hydroxy-3-cyclohexene-1-carboxylate synthase
MTRDANTAFARAVVDEWARAGVTDACVAPGSRSTPLALALADDARIRVHVHLDERSASFFALGVATVTGRAAVVVCTSGTAAANLHPAVLEADHGRVPLVVCTADRPFELRDTGAGQTVDQVGLYGGAVRWSVDVEAPHDAPPELTRAWRAVAARAVAEASGPRPGPVHVNVAFREPLVPTGAPLVDVPARPDGAPWTRVARGREQPDVDGLASRLASVERGVVVAGWGAGVDARELDRLAGALRWPVLADPISNGRSGAHAVSTYEALVRAGFAGEHAPDVVLRFGAPPTSKVTTAWLADRGVAHVVVDPDGAWLDPHRDAQETYACDPTALARALADRVTREPSRWLEDWLQAEAVARRAVDDLLDASEDVFEGRVARDVVGTVPDGGNLVVASSMPVRDVEAFAAPRDGVRFFANRGVNGIDGFVSTALGVASASPGTPTVALVGDLCFLHDGNGLLGAARRGVDAVFVVVDNGGGGIFSFLPQADDGAHFEELFATPQDVDLVAVAAVHGISATRVDKASAVVPAVRDAVAQGGVHAVVVTSDREQNVARHRAAWDAVARALVRR